MKNCLLLFTGAYHTDGGIAAVNRLVIHALVEDGFELDIHVLSECDNAIEPGFNDSLRSNIKYLVYSNNKFTFTLGAWFLLLKNKYDFVIADHVNLASILVPFRFLKRVEYITWLYGIDVFPPRPDWEGMQGLRFASKRLAISNYTCGRVSNRFPHLTVTVCELALDPIRHKPVQNVTLEDNTRLVMENILGQECSLEPKMILHVGRMMSSEGYKGQDILIRAFPIILEKIPTTQLVLVGQGDDMPRLKALASSLSVEVQARIFMPGYVSNELLEHLYQVCYMFAMPSSGEGFGLVYLEAMSRGKPCLGGGVDATPGVVRDGVTGLIVDDPRSSEQVAEKIIWLLANPNEAIRMGQAGFDLVQSNYLFPHFKERFLKAIKN